jgi:hypothetical protein
MSATISKNAKTNLLTLGSEPVLLYSHRFNLSLWETIMLPDYIDGYTIQFQAAAETAKSLLNSLNNNPNDEKAVFNSADQIFRKMGMGNIDFSKISENGGAVSIAEYHFDLANKRENIDNSPTSFVFAAGYLAGTLNYCYGKNFNVRVKSLTKPFLFECSAEESNEEIPSAGLNISSFSDIPAVEEDKTADLFFENLPEEDERGIIEDNGFYLSYLPAAYYNKISYRFEKEMEITAGFEGIAEPLLLETAQIGAFYLLSWIMRTSLWKTQILSNSGEKENLIRAFFSIINTFGWGFWEINELNSGGAITFSVHNSPEGSGFYQEFGEGSLAKCYRISGSAAVITNLVYFGGIETNPVMNEDTYQRIFSNDQLFQVSEIECAAQGADLCRFTISR